jgi:hypothetical protein
MIPKIKMTENLFVDHAEAIEKILRLAARRALQQHKRAGNPIATWRDGQVVILKPEEIPVDDDLEAA